MTLVLLFEWHRPGSPSAQYYEEEEYLWRAVVYLAEVDREWLFAYVRTPSFPIGGRLDVARCIGDPVLLQELQAEEAP